MPTNSKRKMNSTVSLRQYNQKKLDDRLQMQVKRVQHYGIVQMSSNGRVTEVIDLIRKCLGRSVLKAYIDLNLCPI